MLRIESRAAASAEPDFAVALTYAQRNRHRLRMTVPGGEELVLVLPERGAYLRVGDKLAAQDGRVVVVAAAEEELAEVSATDRALARAAYHLGNRHVAVQVLDGRLRFVADHVLERMLDGLGLPVAHVLGAFEPEPGAYASHASGETHSHDHAHEQPHDHEHSHDHNHTHDHEHSHDRAALGRLAPVPAPRIHDFVKK